MPIEETFTPKKYNPSQVKDMLVQIAKFPDILHRTNWVMVGAAGVGKTEILKQLAEAISFKFMEFPIGFMSRGDSFIPVLGKNGHYMMQLAQFWKQAEVMWKKREQAAKA